MWIFLIGCGVIGLGGILSLALSKVDRVSSAVACAAVWLGCGMAAYPAATVLFGGSLESLMYDWYLPFGQFHLAMDGLSAFFMLPILILSPLTALYGVGYLAKKRGRGAHFFFFNALVTSMMMLLVSKDGILFLLSWEVMAMSSFFLVVFDGERKSVRDAGWVYLTATHLGTAALLVFFMMQGELAHSFNFDDFTAVASAGGLSPSLALVLFGLAVFGFGSKAGFFPLHVWLPDAHPAAPSHVSALMSGAMIKMGIYGLVRALLFLGPPPSSFGWTLVGIGLASGLLGIVSALAQHNLKRLLAYSSVENIGIIALGLGGGLLGMSWNIPALAVLGFGGGLLHVLNHSIFKGLLFMGAGALLHQTKTGEMDDLGGLLKSMPMTGFTFLVGAAAICALPPFNGFVSELLIYLAGVQGIAVKTGSAMVLSTGIFVGLALIGGLAVACFTKCFGLVFLGEPRTAHAKDVRDVSFSMIFPMVTLALLCPAVGLGGPFVLHLIAPGINVLTSSDGASALLLHKQADGALAMTAVAGAGMILLFVMFRMIKNMLLRRRNVTVQGVWDCGYAAPSSSMQYTGSSYVRPTTNLFQPFLRTLRQGGDVQGYFPKDVPLSTKTLDFAREVIFFPLFSLVATCLKPFRKLQHGRVHIYVVYVAVTLVATLMLTLGE
jgi:formate hydrogenlyase subunit 3/multisubunit Na+/H+ antiporter MnhD subunit